MLQGGIDLNPQKADGLIPNREPAHVRKPGLEQLYFLKTNGEPLQSNAATGPFALLAAFREELKGGSLVAGA